MTVSLIFSFLYQKHFHISGTIHNKYDDFLRKKPKNREMIIFCGKPDGYHIHISKTMKKTLLYAMLPAQLDGVFLF